MEVDVAAKYVSPAGWTLVTCHACECRFASQISPDLLLHCPSIPHHRNTKLISRNTQHSALLASGNLKNRISSARVPTPRTRAWELPTALPNLRQPEPPKRRPVKTNRASSQLPSDSQILPPWRRTILWLLQEASQTPPSFSMFPFPRDQRAGDPATRP